MDLPTERPPYVTFEKRAIEDRDASLANGRYTTKDVTFALITPQGSKDIVDRIASEWFAMLRDQMDQGRFPRQWYEAFKGAFDAWERDEEAPVNGISIKNWPAIGPSVYNTLRQLKLLTVEDVAAMNEESIQRVGMGARALKQQAMDYLVASKDVGQVAGQLSAEKQARLDAEARNSELMERVNKLEALVMKLSPDADIGQAKQVDTGAAPDNENSGNLERL